MQDVGKGWGNLLTHITSNHPDYLDTMKSLNMDKSRTLDAFINKGASTIYYWLELIVMCNLPFSFVENQYIRKGMKYSDISVDTLMKYIRKLTAAVEEEKSNHLPEKFGLIVDGWSEGSTKKRKISAESKYIDLTWIPPTSNIVERLFSAARLVLTDYRKSMFDPDLYC